MTICYKSCYTTWFSENSWLHDDFWSTKNEFSKKRRIEVAVQYNPKRSLYSDCWWVLYAVQENQPASRFFSQNKFVTLWKWWDLINKNARYRVAVRFACEAAVSGGVNIKAISETFSCGNCSWISNLLQICYTICYNPLTMSSVLVIWVHVRTNSLQNGNSESSIGIQASWVTFRKLGWN